MRALNVTPHIAQNISGRRSAIDSRTTRHPGYAVSQRKRKRIEEPFGWARRSAGSRGGWSAHQRAAGLNGSLRPGKRTDLKVLRARDRCLRTRRTTNRIYRFPGSPPGGNLAWCRRWLHWGRQGRTISRRRPPTRRRGPTSIRCRQLVASQLRPGAAPADRLRVRSGATMPPGAITGVPGAFWLQVAA
jgi:hypothetical protein